METTTRTPAWIGACARALDARGAGRQLAILTRALAMPVLGIAIFAVSLFVVALGRPIPIWPPG